MYSDLFSQKSVQDLLTVLPSLPFALWETFYVTVVSTALSLVIGLPLGVLLVVGEKPGSEKLELAERRCGQVRRIDAAHFKFMLEQDLTVSPDEFAACFAA